MNLNPVEQKINSKRRSITKWNMLRIFSIINCDINSVGGN